MAKYELTEPFYDNLVLWDAGDVIEFDGVPSPTMIPLDAAGVAALEQLHKERGEAYVPPLSELPDHMDGTITTSPFNPGDRKHKVNTKPAFPITPGKPGSGKEVAAKTVPLMAVMPSQSVKPNKNFDRAPR